MTAQLVENEMVVVLTWVLLDYNFLVKESYTQALH